MAQESLSQGTAVAADSYHRHPCQPHRREGSWSVNLHSRAPLLEKSPIVLLSLLAAGLEAILTEDAEENVLPLARGHSPARCGNGVLLLNDGDGGTLVEVDGRVIIGLDSTGRLQVFRDSLPLVVPWLVSRGSILLPVDGKWYIGRVGWIFSHGRFGLTDNLNIVTLHSRDDGPTWGYTCGGRVASEQPTSDCYTSYAYGTSSTEGSHI